MFYKCKIVSVLVARSSSMNIKFEHRAFLIKLIIIKLITILAARNAFSYQIYMYISLLGITKIFAFDYCYQVADVTKHMSHNFRTTTNNNNQPKKNWTTSIAANGSNIYFRFAISRVDCATPFEHCAHAHARFFNSREVVERHQGGVADRSIDLELFVYT